MKHYLDLTHKDNLKFKLKFTHNIFKIDIFAIPDETTDNDRPVWIYISLRTNSYVTFI